MTAAAITLHQGDTYTNILTVTDAAGAPIDLTGATLTFHLRARGGTAGAIDPAPTLALTTPAAGVATLTLTAAETATLTAAGRYRYEVELVDAFGNVTTPVEGLLYVEADIG